MRLLVWIAIGLSSFAPIMMVSRAAMLASLSVTGVSLLLFNRWDFAAKSAITGIAMLCVIVMMLSLTSMWISIVPLELTARFSSSHEEFESLVKISQDLVRYLG